MSTQSTPEKLIRRMHRSYNDARKLIKQAMAECSVGTNTHLQHVKALAELDAKERAEEIAIGIVPQDLQKATKTEYLYIAHCHTIPANREEMEKLLNAQAIKACKGLHYEPADEAIRKDLEEKFK